MTQRAITEDEEDVAKQAIEFWCTVAEEETDIQQVSDDLYLLSRDFCAISEADSSLLNPASRQVTTALTYSNAN